MLVLSRRTDESVKIGDDIEVMVVKIEGDRVRLGFRCPPDVPVWRTEIMPSNKHETLTPNPERKHHGNDIGKTGNG